MKLLRSRVSIRSLMIGVALVGLNLAALKASLSHYPRPVYYPGITWGPATYISGHDGSYSRYDGPSREHLEYLKGKTRAGHKLLIIHSAKPISPTLLRIWLPVIASGAFTIVVLLVAGLRRRDSKSPGEGGIP